MKPHEQRVLQEYVSLAESTLKLRTFLETDKPEYVTELQWDLMVQQYGLMVAYCNVLQQRIDTFNNEE